MKPLPGQQSLFGEGHSALPQYDAAPVNPSVPQDDAARIANQQAAILAALRDGPKTGPELATIAIRYSARLQEMKALHPWLKRPIGGGQFEYRLI